MIRQALVLFAVVFLISFSACAQQLPETGVGLTVYNDNFAVIHDTRNIGVVQGTNTIQFTDVPETIDPTSIIFNCLSDPEVEIITQSYQGALSARNILERYIGENIVVYLRGSGADEGKRIEGQLLSMEGNEVVIQTQDRVQIFTRNMIENYSLPMMDLDYAVRPSIAWQLSAPKSGEPLCRISYMAQNMRWKAIYTSVFDSEEDTISFSGWINLENNTGKDFQDASLKLVAGDVQREQAQQGMPRARSMMYEAAAPKQVQQRELSEYHMYDVEGNVAINNNEVKQIRFIEPVKSIPAGKKFVYQRYKNSEKVQIKIEFDNDPNQGLGVALPMGTIKMYKEDVDQVMEFIGEGSIDHTAKGETISLQTGNAFDLVPEYKLLNSEKGRKSRTDTHEITLRNRKEEAVEIIVEERFPQWVNWDVQQASHEFEKVEATKIRFTVQIPAESEEVIQYTATERW